jgi:hypothetical protein
MNDEELNKRLDTLEGYIEVLAKTVTDQTIMIQAMRAHQAAHFGELRKLLSKQVGETPAMLRQRLKSAYQEALRQFSDQYKAFQQDGDINKLLDRTPTPDDIWEN